MTVHTFVCIGGHRERAFWTVASDQDNKRVTVYFGRIGTQGNRRVRRFNSREEVRAYTEKAIDKRLAHGYEQVA